MIKDYTVTGTEEEWKFVAAVLQAVVDGDYEGSAEEVTACKNLLDQLETQGIDK